MLAQKKFAKISEKLASIFMKKNQLDSTQVQAMLDESLISHKGYSILYKALATKVQSRKNKDALLRRSM